MSLTPPNLDDRRWQDLVDEARERAARHAPQWTDHSPHDPGVILLELFAHLTEVLLYRLNRLPGKAYVEFLRLMGVQRRPPIAARATLHFSLADGADGPVVVPESTVVATSQPGPEGEPIRFVTAERLEFSPGSSAQVSAHHCELEAERVGVGTDLAGQVVSVSNPPIVDRLPDGIDLIVGVEASPGEEVGVAREFEGRSFQIWREVGDFAAVEPDDRVYVVDRCTGRIQFAPAVDHWREEQHREPSEPLAAAPGQGREIRVWYRRGGGAAGNVAAGAITRVESPLPAEVRVTNPEPAASGRDVESVENALRRGPLTIRAPDRVLTEDDYENWVVANAGIVNRALAGAEAGRWSHGKSGRVEVRLVPALQNAERPRPVSLDELLAHQESGETERERTRLEARLRERQPLGTNSGLRWARYKRVTVTARVVAHRAEGESALIDRLERRLHETINPLRFSGRDSPWPFGAPIRASQIYGIMLDDPGVSFVDGVTLSVDTAPDRDVAALCRDAHQAGTWYAASGSGVFRSENGGDGWELVYDAGAGTRILCLEAHPDAPGYLAVAFRSAEAETDTEVRVSKDCGETFSNSKILVSSAARDLAWLRRADGTSYLFVASDTGLFGLEVDRPGNLELIAVDPDRGELGVLAVATGFDDELRPNVAVSAEGDRGVYLSYRSGQGRTFFPLGDSSQLRTKALAIGRTQGRAYLWAGPGADSDLRGCRRCYLAGSEIEAQPWEALEDGWQQSGGCAALAFDDSSVFAATDRGGVLQLRLGEERPSWACPDLGSQLPPAEGGGFERVVGVAFQPVTGDGGRLMAAVASGIYRSGDRGRKYEHCSRRNSTERITLPRGWLPCSGSHEIIPGREDASGTD